MNEGPEWMKLFKVEILELSLSHLIVQVQWCECDVGVNRGGVIIRLVETMLL
jgi:hypothetical protein